MYIRESAVESNECYKFKIGIWADSRSQVWGGFVVTFVLKRVVCSDE
jgi:hypothetical protein